MPLSKLVIDVGRACRLLLGRYVADTTDRPYNQLKLLQIVATGECGAQAHLAERLFIDPPAVSRAVDKLEADGLLRRAEGADRRCVKLAVTDAAAAEIQHIELGHERLDEIIDAALDEADRKELRRLLEKVEVHLRAAS